MPPYNNQPGVAVPMLPLASVPGPPGPPGYAFGSRALNQPTCRMMVTNSSVSSNVVTLTVKVVEGNIPAVGQTLYIYATTNSAGGLNDSTGTITIASVSINATTGIGTITYAKTVGNQASTPDVGYVLAPVPEVGEALTGSSQKSQQFAVSGYGVSWAYLTPSAPVSLAIQLEGAIGDSDGEYTLIGTSQTTVSSSAWTEVFATLPENVNFVRLHVTASSGGTLPTIIAKIQLTRS
jgi:hypothetical protein